MLNRSRPRRRLVGSAVLAVTLVCLTSGNLTLFRVPTGSMAPAVRPGDYVLVARAGIHPRLSPWGPGLPAIRRPGWGAIVAVEPRTASGVVLVKRVAGVPGDTLRMEKGVLFRNDARVTGFWESPVSCPPDAREAEYPAMRWARTDQADEGVDMLNWPTFVVPADQYFMLGQDLCRSLDSRFWGLAERDEMVGSVVWISGRALD